MLTKPKSAYSLTHTIIWDSLYCYSTARAPRARTSGCHHLESADTWRDFAES